jgi:hypothetical protein
MKKLLKDVTLIAYSSGYIKESIESLRKSYEGLYFGDVKLLSHELPDSLPLEIKWEYAPKINEINDYNSYIFKHLGKHVNTSHCLLIQNDSWILHPELWDDDWLQWDYIGAPWGYVQDAYIANNGERVRVGNGGFSLRSSYLLDLPKIMEWDLREEQGWANEDGNICCYYRKEMLENGIKYAPIEVASKFSYENDVPENINIKEFFGRHKHDPRR